MSSASSQEASANGDNARNHCSSVSHNLTILVNDQEFDHNKHPQKLLVGPNARLSQTIGYLYARKRLR